MYKKWLKAVIVLSLICQLSYAMSPTHRTSQPTLFKEQQKKQETSSYINKNFNLDSYENFDLSDFESADKLKTLEKQLLHLIKRYKEPKELYFRYYLILKLREKIDPSILYILLEQIKMDKDYSDLAVILLILSLLDNIETPVQFDIAYRLLKDAIIKYRSVYLCKPISKNSNLINDFNFGQVLNFDPAKFEDTDLLEIFIRNQNGKAKPFFDLYELIFCLRSDLKKNLLDKVTSKPNFQEQYLNTPLAQTIYNNNFFEMKELITPTNINKSCNAKGFTPLMLAVVFESEDIIKYLLHLGGELLIKSDFGRHALYYALASKNHNILNLLDIDQLITTNLNDLLETVILTKDSELFNNIIDNINYYDLNPTSIENWMSTAAKKNRVSMLGKLLKLDPDVNFDRLFIDAIENNCTEVAELLKRKIDRNSKAIKLLPFVIAKAGDLFKMNLLINTGINVGLENNEEETPFVIAEQDGYNEIAAILDTWMTSREFRSMTKLGEELLYETTSSEIDSLPIMENFKLPSLIESFRLSPIIESFRSNSDDESTSPKQKRSWSFFKQRSRRTS